MATLRQRVTLSKDSLFLDKVRAAMIFTAKYKRDYTNAGTQPALPATHVTLAYNVIADANGYLQRFADMVVQDDAVFTYDVEDATNFDNALKTIVDAVWADVAPLS